MDESLHEGDAGLPKCAGRFGFLGPQADHLPDELFGRAALQIVDDFLPSDWMHATIGEPSVEDNGLTQVFR